MIFVKNGFGDFKLDIELSNLAAGLRAEFAALRDQPVVHLASADNSQRSAGLDVLNGELFTFDIEPANGWLLPQQRIIRPCVINHVIAEQDFGVPKFNGLEEAGSLRLFQLEFQCLEEAVFPNRDAHMVDVDFGDFRQ